MGPIPYPPDINNLVTILEDLFKPPGTVGKKKQLLATDPRRYLVRWEEFAPSDREVTFVRDPRGPYYFRFKITRSGMTEPLYLFLRRGLHLVWCDKARTKRGGRANVAQEVRDVMMGSGGREDHLRAAQITREFHEVDYPPRVEFHLGKVCYSVRQEKPGVLAAELRRASSWLGARLNLSVEQSGTLDVLIANSVKKIQLTGNR